MSTEIKNPLLRLLIYGHVWLALGATAQVWWMCDLLRTYPEIPMLFAFTATFSVYGWMRLMRMNVLRTSLHMTWFRTHRVPMLIAIAVSGGVAAFTLFQLLPGLHPMFWLAGACAALYVLPSSPKARQVWGLRRVPGLKSFLIAFAWAAMTLSVAMSGGEGHVRTQVIQLFAMQFCFFLAIALVFDIRDVHYDMPSIRSVPQLIGERWTRVLAVILMLVPIWMFTAVVLVQNALSREYVTDVPIRWSPVFVLAGYLIAAILIGRKASAHPLYHDLLLDGLLILIPLMAWIGGLL
jgi:hypothetical protein